MTTSIDPIPALLAQQITGLRRVGNDGPFIRLIAQVASDGHAITVQVIEQDFTVVGDVVTKRVLHISPPIPVEVDAEALVIEVVSPPVVVRNGSIDGVDPVVAGSVPAGGSS